MSIFILLRKKVFVNVQVSVQYKVLVEKAYDAFYRLTDPGVQIRSHAFDVVRSTVPRMTLDEAFVSKSTIADSIMEQLYRVMNDYGYVILTALVTNLTPDQKVKMSMNEIEASKRLKAAIPHRAEAGW
jgi:regulator of protease activity HflC (stomatin/prohibitin superfamily)